MKQARSSKFRRSFKTAIVALSLLSGTILLAEDVPRSIPEAPPRNEGEGPFSRLILRGGTLIDGTGAPAIGPVDIIVEGNRIVDIKNVGVPGVPIDAEKRPQAGAEDRELNIEGMYILPGLIDMHGHIGGLDHVTANFWVVHFECGRTTSK
ncbi:MAG: hypothetical protein GWP16_00945 [Nitrospirae bacterium]|nr:hypothetical protein [Nitrospirota bacterium]